MSLPEALYIVSQNAHGVKHNYALYNAAILMVNARYPHPGNTVDIDDETGGESWTEWNLSQARVYEVKRGDGL